MAYPLSMVFFDVVNVCNLTCPFCSTDWDKIRKGVVVKNDVLKKVFQLAPYVNDASLSLSCAHEPTLHPKLADILDGLPDRFRKKFFMTSNLTTKMPDRLMESIACSGINHLNISCDSLEEGTFEHLRRDGKLPAFLDNVKRLVAAIHRADPARRPKIRLITMGFKSNFHEIPKLVEYGKSIGAYWHEVRFMFDMPHVPEEFKRRELLDEAQWDWLVEFAKNQPTLHVFMPPLGYRYSHQLAVGETAAPAIGLGSGRHIEFTPDAAPSPQELGDPPVVEAAFAAMPDDESVTPSRDLEAGNFGKIEAGQPRRKKEPPVAVAGPPRTMNGTVLPFPLLTEPPTLHVGPDGSAVVSGWGELFEINLLSLPDPGLFFSALSPGFVSPLSSDMYGYTGDIAILDLLPGVHGDAIAVIDDSNRAAVWGGDLRLEIYVPSGAVPSFRVAYCHNVGPVPHGQFIDVVEKYFILHPGYQVISLRIADCVSAVGQVTDDNMTRIHMGGSVQDAPSTVYLSAHILVDGEVVPLSLVSTTDSLSADAEAQGAGSQLRAAAALEEFIGARTGSIGA